MEEDDELQQIRARRMAELQKQQAGRAGARGPGGPQQGPSPQEQAQKREQEEEMRNSILSQILTQEARSRRKFLILFSLFMKLITSFPNPFSPVNILKAAKPDKAKLVEDILINNARMGALRGRVCAFGLEFFDSLSNPNTLF